MAILQSCCFWKTVRKGSFASAIYTLFYFTFSTIIMSIYMSDEKEFLSGAKDQPNGESILIKGDITPATVIFNILFLICSVFLVISSILILIGLRYNKRKLLIPWILFMLSDIMIEIAHLLYLTFMQRVTFDPIVGFLFTIDFFIMILNSYCLLCVISQYQEYQQGRGYDNAQLNPDVVGYVNQNQIDDMDSNVQPFTKKHTILMMSNQHSHLTTIPENVTQDQKIRLNSEDISNSGDESNTGLCDFHGNVQQKDSKIPIITLDPNSGP